MSTVAIVVIVVVVVLVLLGLFFVAPRIRERSRLASRTRELRSRREEAISEHREEAERRERSAQEHEQRARIAQQEAERERAEAQLRQEKATLHERGMADPELVDDEEREHFAGTSAAPDPGSERDRA
jgi:FtsZ-interacting cell division protein ZipA